MKITSKLLEKAEREGYQIVTNKALSLKDVKKITLKNKTMYITIK